MPSLIQLIKNGDPWAHFTQCGQHKKKDVKPLIYSFCYGMGSANLKKNAQMLGLEYLLDDAIFVKLLKSRHRWWASYPKDNNGKTYIVDCYGKKHTERTAGYYVDDFGHVRNQPKDRHIGSLAASYIQAIEFNIMSKVASIPDIEKYLVGWIHDSIITTKSMHDEIKTVIESAAKDLGNKFNIDLSAITIEEKQL
jgi:hypothetical protein